MPAKAEVEGSRDILRALREDSRRKLVSQLLEKLCLFLIVLGLLNFGSFLVGTIVFGGDALNGKVSGDKYYLWGYGYHMGAKGFHQVSRAVFNYSRWHTYSNMVTWPVMLVAGFIAERIRGHSDH